MNQKLSSRSVSGVEGRPLETRSITRLSAFDSICRRTPTMIRQTLIRAYGIQARTISARLIGSLSVAFSRASRAAASAASAACGSAEISFSGSAISTSGFGAAVGGVSKFHSCFGFQNCRKIASTAIDRMLAATSVTWKIWMPFTNGRMWKQAKTY